MSMSTNGATVAPNIQQVTDLDTSVLSREEEYAVTAEHVAKVVAGIPAIGAACAALKREGRRAGIAGNRITVDDEVFAQLMGATIGRYGAVEAMWVVSSIAGTPPVWIVGAEPPRHASVAATGRWSDRRHDVGDGHHQR
jgi:hypothetical protein